MTVNIPETGINIKDLILEPQVRTNEGAFEPRVEITTQDWEKIIRSTEEFKDFKADPNNNWKLFITMAAHVATIDPKKAEILKNSVNWSPVFQAIKKFEQADKFLTTPVLPREMGYFRIFAPELARTYTPEPNYKNWLMHQYTSRPDRAHMEIFQRVAETQVAFPHLLDNYFSESDIAGQIEGANRLEDLFRRTRDPSVLVRCAEAMVNLRIVAPDEFSDFKLPPSDFWEEARQVLNHYRQNPANLSSFLNLTSLLTILAAEQMEISEDSGLKLILSGKGKDSIPDEQLPERRKF